mmetsp:Transcript_47275/g.39901  ORF Transcript_47275/g.39901 Transcript_47275/m.39901 type:complete len:96 (+) Transcript_47275:597-884(+)
MKLADIVKNMSNQPNDVKFASAKEFTRANVKILEDVTADCKFPLKKLKDIARGSFYFADPGCLLKAFNEFKEKVEATEGLQLLQVKNLFKNGGDG